MLAAGLAVLGLRGRRAPCPGGRVDGRGGPVRDFSSPVKAEICTDRPGMAGLLPGQGDDRRYCPVRATTGVAASALLARGTRCDRKISAQARQE